MRDYLRKMRKAAGLSQTQVAKELGMAQTNYSAIENGRTQTMQTSTMKALADIYGIDIAYISQQELKYGLSQE